MNASVLNTVSNLRTAFIICLIFHSVALVQAETPSKIRVEHCQLSVMDRVTLSSERVGQLIKINAVLGQYVNASDILIQLDDSVTRATLDTARKQANDKIELRFAEKASELSRLEYTRAKELNIEVPGAVPELEIRRLRLSAEKSLLQIEQAALQLELANSRVKEIEASLSTYQIKAPMRGTVVKRHKNSGEVVQPGEEILEIVGNDRLQIEGHLPLEHVWTVKSGDPIVVRVNIPKVNSPINTTAFTGKILLIEDEVTELSKEVRFVGVVSNKNGLLRAGLPASIEIHPIKATTTAGTIPSGISR